MRLDSHWLWHASRSWNCTAKYFAAFEGERENWHALEFADAALWSGSFSILFAQSQIFAPLFEITLHNSPFYDECPINMPDVFYLPCKMSLSNELNVSTVLQDLSFTSRPTFVDWRVWYPSQVGEVCFPNNTLKLISKEIVKLFMDHCRKLNAITLSASWFLGSDISFLNNWRLKLFLKNSSMPVSCKVLLTRYVF